MVDEPTVAKRFSKDLRQIREERGISIDEVHSKTRIARTLIESFEKGHLYDHESYNRVYLRSFVKAYAEAVDISVQQALDGLKDALDGTYDGWLAEEFIRRPRASDEGSQREADSGASPDESEETEEFSNVPSAGGPDGRGGIVGPPRAVGEDDSEAPDADAASAEEEEESAAEVDAEESDPDPDPDNDQEPSRSEHSPSPSSPSTDDDGTDTDDERRSDADGDNPSWLEDEGSDEDAPSPSFPQQDSAAEPDVEAPSAGMGEGGVVGEPTPLGSSSEEEGTTGARSQEVNPSRQQRSSGSASWNPFSGHQEREMYLAAAGIAIVVVVLAGLAFLFFSSEEPAPETTSPANVDTTEAAASAPDTAATQPERPPPANLTLGETLHLTVRATANVSNLRVQRDEDLRRPYWIEDGEANVFPFERQVTLQNELEDIDLFLEGYPYPMPNDTTGGIEITRSQAEAFADTLRGAPPSLSAVPDTIPVGAPAE